MKIPLYDNLVPGPAFPLVNETAYLTERWPEEIRKMTIPLYTALFECSKTAKHSYNYFDVGITFTAHYVIELRLRHFSLVRIGYRIEDESK